MSSVGSIAVSTYVTSATVMSSVGSARSAITIFCAASLTTFSFIVGAFSITCVVVACSSVLT